MSNKKTIIICGGGTGGHIFPALAIATALQQLRPNLKLHFVGSRHGLEKDLIPKHGYSIDLLNSGGLYNKKLTTQVLNLLRLVGAVWRSILIIRQKRPQLVIGVGGYASAPMLLAALLLRVPTVIQEQNSAPGLTNRYLGRWVNLVITPFGDEGRLFPRTQTCSNPVRQEIEALRQHSPPKSQKLFVLIFGGSQGAKNINQAIIGLLPQLNDYAQQVELVHQTGINDLEEVRQSYAKYPQLKASILPFIDNMDYILGQANLTICRAGATTVSELIAARKASIIIPIKHSSGDHQRRNALKLQEIGAAIMVEEGQELSQRLWHAIHKLIEDKPMLEGMSAKTDGLYQPQAALRIAKICLEVANLKNDH